MREEDGENEKMGQEEKKKKKKVKKKAGQGRKNTEKSDTEMYLEAQDAKP